MSLKRRLYPPIPLYPEWKQDIAVAKALTHVHAKSFSAGIKFFPKEVRESTYALYAFVRIPDDIVDEQGLTDDQASEALSTWINRWNIARRDIHQSTEPAFRLMHYTMERHGIPDQLVDDFFASMIMDTKVKTYTSYAQLSEYMHGSASVIGEMMTRICGTSSDDAIPGARALGEAFQLTNFIRDIDADYCKRGRIYIPSDLLSAHSVTHEWIINRRPDAQWNVAINSLISDVRILYKTGRSAIPYLSHDCQFGVALAADIYEAILDRVQDKKCDVFNGRVGTTTMEKLTIFGRRKLLPSSS